MKERVVLLALLLSSCSAQTTAPNSAGRPFPNSFHQLTVWYQDIPENWTEYHESYTTDWTTHQRTTSSGHGDGAVLLSGVVNETVAATAFSKSGDTLKAPELIIVFDSINGMLTNLELTVPNDQNYAGGSFTRVTCRQIPFTYDSTGNIVSTLNGVPVKDHIVRLDSAAHYAANGEFAGQSESYSRTFADSALASSSITIRLKP